MRLTASARRFRLGWRRRRWWVRNWASMWREHLSEPRALGHWVQLLFGQHIGNISRLLLKTAGEFLHLLLLVLFMSITLVSLYPNQATAWRLQ